MIDNRAGAIFVPELLSRLHWFVHLRWLAAVALAGIALWGESTGQLSAAPGLLLVAVFVAACNLVFDRAARTQSAAHARYTDLRRLGHE